MSKARRAIHRSRGPLVLALGLSVAVIAAAGVAIAMIGPDDGSPSGQPSPTASTPAQTAKTVQRAVAPADACNAVLAATGAVLTAARTAAGHWREHVAARTDLLAGKNSEAVTREIWKRTRLAGPADIARLDAALVAQRSSAGGCATLTGASAAACNHRLKVLQTAAAANRAAAADWERHLAMMAAHAAGDFGAEHAQHLWVAAWSGATRNLNAAARADTTLVEAPTCRPS
jgi:hypothetical protein